MQLDTRETLAKFNHSEYVSRVNNNYTDFVIDLSQGLLKLSVHEKVEYYLLLNIICCQTFGLKAVIRHKFSDEKGLSV